MKTKSAEFIWFDGEFKPWDSVNIPIQLMYYIMELLYLRVLEGIQMRIIYIFLNLKNIYKG